MKRKLQSHQFLLINYQKKIFSYILFLFVHFVLAQTTITQTITKTGSGIITVPCDVISITVEAWGAGGAGGGSTSNNSKGGGGGAGGAYVKSTLTVTPGSSINYTVGVGATGGTNDGSAGGDTWFSSNSTLLAKGGAGGISPAGTRLGGVGTIIGSIGDNKIAGTNGGDGSTTASGAGGQGGNSGGAGGASSTSESDGANGNQPGGGGSGAYIPDATKHSGGSGGNGQIIITYTTKYCGKTFANNVEPITNVTFAGINNTTPDTINGSLSNEYFCSPAASVQQGEAYTISLSGNTNGDKSNYFSVYVDWDQNGVFGNNTDEIYDIGIINNSTSGTITGSITVPAGAVLGTTTIRVVKNRNSYSDTCANVNNGQTEDYQVVVSAPTCSALGGTTALSITTGNPNTPFTASVSDSSNNTAAYDFQWEKSPDNISWSSIAGETSTTASITAEPIETTFYYRRKITCKSSGIVTYSSSVSFTTVVNYCTPVFNTSNIGKLYISSFKFIGVLNDDFQVSNVSTQSGTNGDYKDFTTLTPIAEQVRGSVVNIEAISDGTFTSSSGIVGWGYWMAWVDWNRDGTFDDATERVYALQDYLTKSVTFGFVITTDKPLGDYRIRIATMSNKSTNPCGLSSAYGEVEDYMFKVVEDNEAKLDTSKPDLFNRCGDGEITLQVYGDAKATGFNWYSAKYGGTLLHSGDVNTGSVFTTNITGTTTYYVAVVDGNGKETPFRYPIVARKDPIPEVYFTPTPETICGEDDPSLLLNVWGDNREVVLFDERFNSELGVFDTQSEDTNVSDGSSFTGYSYVWKTVASPLEQKNPPHLAIASSVSSGYFGGNFAIMNSDGADRLGGKNIKRHLYTINTYDTTAFLPNKLYLDFDLYYFSIAQIEADGYFNVEYSLDGTNWTKFTTFVLNQGNPLFWSKNVLDLDALNVPRSANIKFRFSLFSRGLSSGGYFENVATLDNVKLWGSIPVDRDYEWSGIDAGVLYDQTCTTPLGTSLARTVCVKPPIDEFEKPYWDLYASATFQGGCPAIGSTRVYNDTKIWNQPGKIDWNQANDWKPVGVPTIAKCVIARTPVELPSGTTGTHGLARSVIVKSGGTLTISPKSSLTIKNYIKNEAAAGDVLVDNDANLIQNNNSAVNSGNITVKRSANLKRLDYNYWGTPVAGQNVKAFSQGTLESRFYVYNESNDYFDGLFIKNKYPDNSLSLTATENSSTYTFIKGKGYGIRASNSLTNVTSPQMHSFVGVPNNGIVDIPLLKSATGGGYNLISNPYPSNIDFDKLYNYSTNSSIIYNTAYFWTNTNFNPKMQGSSYPSNLPSGTQIINNYAVLNGTGGVAAPYATGDGNNDPIGSPSNCPLCTTPNQYIKVGQGFIVKAKSGGNLKIENGSNIRTNNANAVFFNRMASNRTAEITKDRFWLSLKTPLDFVTPLLIGYLKGATNNFEEDYDAELFVHGGDSFYSLLEDKKLAIQGRSPFNIHDKISLGATFGLQGQYEIFIENKEGIFASQQPVYLKDNLTGQIINLSQDKYIFTANAGDTTNRFEIQYTNEGTLNTSDSKNQSTVVYQEQNYIIIESPSVIKSVKVFDASGKLVHQSIEKEKKVTVSSINFSKGIYILEIVTDKGKEIEKIVK